MRDRIQLRAPIETSRLTLRLLRDDDLPALLSYRSRDDVCRWLPFAPMDRAELRRRMQTQWRATRLERDGDAVTLGIEVNRTRRLIGDVVLFVRSRDDGCGEIGWVQHPDAEGNGYATEAAEALLGVAFDRVRLHRVVAQMHPDNAPSARLAERLGMRREALYRRDSRIRGQWEDTLLYAMLEDEWRARRTVGATIDRSR